MYCKSCGVEIYGEDELCSLCMMFPKRNRNGQGEEDEEGEKGGKKCEEDEQEIGYLKGLYFHNIEYNYLNPETIWSFRQNIPELIVQDCIKEFNFDDEQTEKLRIILMARGVNKWMFARREFIKLKHEVLYMLKSKESPYDRKDVHRVIEKIYVKMQKIARIPRWIKWPNTITHKWKNIEKDIEVKGKQY